MIERPLTSHEAVLRENVNIPKPLSDFRGRFGIFLESRRIHTPGHLRVSLCLIQSVVQLCVILILCCYGMAIQLAIVLINYYQNA